jgi:hypothetical protein
MYFIFNDFFLSGAVGLADWKMGLFYSGSHGMKIGALLFSRCTKATHNSAIYKLTNEPVGCLGKHCSFIVPCPLNNV